MVEGVRPWHAEQEEALRRIEDAYSLVTSTTALRAWQLIHDIYQKSVSKERIKSLHDREIDAAASEAMREALNEIPFSTHMVSSEGDKHGRNGGMAAPSLKGIFGQETHPKIYAVNDVVEGTSFAANNQDGACSVIAVTTTPNGIRQTPEGIYHMVKLVCASDANGTISLKNPHEENLRALMEFHGITDPKDLTQITMNPYKDGRLTREINCQFIDPAERMGVTVKLIPGGDFMAAVYAIYMALEKKQAILYVGRGGNEEGTLTAAAVKALGGFMHGQDCRINQFGPDTLGEILSLDQLVPANKELIALVSSNITRDPWFFQPGVTKNSDGRHTVATMVVDSKEGLSFQQATLGGDLRIKL